MGTNRPGIKKRLESEGPLGKTSRLISLREIDFRANVEWLAGRRGYSLRKLAYRSGISERTLHNLLKGKTKPAFSTVVLLAETLSVQPADLLLPPLELKAKIPEGYAPPVRDMRR